MLKRLAVHSGGTMRFARCMLLLLLFFIVFRIIVSPSSVFAWSGKVVKVTDGDTITVLTEGKQKKVRLYGIDCPEYQQPHWQEASRVTRQIVLGQTVDINPIDIDPYGRTVALVWQREILLNVELVRLGLAWVYPQFCTTDWPCHQMEELQIHAKEGRVGLWSDDRPVPPWKWKRIHPSVYQR